MTYHLLKFRYTVNTSTEHTTYVVLDEKQVNTFRRSQPLALTYSPNEEDGEENNCSLVETVPLPALNETARKCLNNRTLYNAIVRWIRKEEATHFLVYYEKQCDYQDKRGYLKYYTHPERARVLLTKSEYQHFRTVKGYAKLIPCTQGCSEHRGESIWLYSGHRCVMSGEADSIPMGFNRDIAYFFNTDIGITLLVEVPIITQTRCEEVPDGETSDDASDDEDCSSDEEDKVIIDAKLFDSNRSWLQELKHSFLIKHNACSSPESYAFGKLQEGEIVPLTLADIELAQDMGLGVRDLASEL